MAIAALLLAVVGGSVSTPAHSEPLNDLLPHTHTSLVAKPAPMPKASEGRIPVSLRLADTIWTDNGSHPPAASQVLVDLDKQYRLDLSGVQRCPGGIHYDIRTEESPCEKFKFATGAIKVEVAFPEQEPVFVAGSAIAFKTDRGKIMIRVFLSAPITGEVRFPATIRRAPDSRYGARITAAIPKLAGGSGSLVYLGLRFRKGLFSAACPDGRLQSGVTASFADGSVAGGSVITTC